jgi:hypothetical protein
LPPVFSGHAAIAEMNNPAIPVTGFTGDLSLVIVE